MAELMYDIDNWPDHVSDRLAWLLRPQTAESYMIYHMSGFYSDDGTGLDMPPTNGFALSLVSSDNDGDGLVPRIYAFGIYSIDEDKDGNAVTNFSPWFYIPDIPWSDDDRDRYKWLQEHQYGIPDAWEFIDKLKDDPLDNPDSPDGR